MKSKLIAAVMLIIGALIIAPVAAQAADFSGSEWRTTTFQIGGENPRAHYYTYGSKETALDNYTMFTENDDTWYQTLKDPDGVNGSWRFKFASSPSTRPWPDSTLGVLTAFDTLTYDDSSWDHIAVPSNWQVNWNENSSTFKYERIIYTNITYPWYSGNTGNTVASAGLTPLFTDTMTFNGVGTYRRHFTVPANWTDRKVTLNFDGADNFYVWVNGNEVGYSEDSMTHHEFDISSYLNYSGDNVIAVQVIRWSTGSFFEDQDFIRVSGIFRDIYLLARQPVDLYDFEVKTTPTTAGSYSGSWNLAITTLIRDWNTSTAGRDSTVVNAALYTVDGTKIDETSGTASTWATITTTASSTTYTSWAFGMGYRNLSFPGSRVSLNFTNLDVEPWSAEHPNLYKLVLWVGDEYVCIRVGFREVTWTIGSSTTARILINGQRIMNHGTNIHETNPETGRVMTLELIRKDIELMKQNNVNAIRMSHYPHDTRYYDLADEYGLYVMDESNIECHQTPSLSNNSTYGPMLRDRTINMVERDKNYACVVFWSLGNECYYGDSSTFRSYTGNWVNVRDSSRPIHSEFDASYGGGNSVYAMYSRMYPSATAFNTAVTSATKVGILCEYVHAMGNSNGNWYAYIDVFENNAKAIGGYIWDWVDQSIYTPQPSNPSETYLAFGGDWGDNPNDNDFCANGMILADRTPKPQVAEMKYQYQMIRGEKSGNTDTNVTYTLRNKFLFTNLSEYNMNWTVTENGVVIKEGAVDEHAVDPCPSTTTANKWSSRAFTTEFGDIDVKPGAEYLFDVFFTLKEDTVWADEGFEIAREQFPLTITGTSDYAAPTVPAQGLTVSGSTGNWTITGTNPSLKIVFTGGYMTQYQYKGRDLLSAGPKPNLFRAPVDNDMNSSHNQARFLNLQSNSTYTTGTMSMTQTDSGNLVVITVPSSNTYANLTATQTYSIYSNGEIRVNETFAFSAAPSTTDGTLAEIGTMLTVVPGLENLTWYGRGPAETYVDRMNGSTASINRSTVSDNFTNYIKTQETGNHVDTRWVALTDDAGFGLLVKAGKFAANTGLFTSGTTTVTGISYDASNLVEFNATHYTPSQLATAVASGQSTDSYRSPYSQHPYQLFNSYGANNSAKSTTLRINLAGNGVGGDDAWGAWAFAAHSINVKAAKTFYYNYTLLPIDSLSDETASQHYSEVRNISKNITDLLPIAVANGISTSASVYTAAAAYKDSYTSEITATNAYNNLKAAVDAMNGAITAFAVTGYDGVINSDSDTITVTVPYGTDVTSITPNLKYVGTSYEPTGVVNFSTPQEFVVTGENGAAKTYTVTVIVEAADACELTAFSIDSYIATISGTNVSVTLPYGYDISSVDASRVEYVTSVGASVSTTFPLSFTSGKASDFAVVALDGATTKTFKITITIADPVITGLVTSSPVFATTDTQGISGLPSTMQVYIEGVSDPVAANVTWTNRTFTAYETVTASGSVRFGSSNSYSFIATVEVIKPGTMYWINSGSGSTGSNLYDAVKTYVDSQGTALINRVSDQSYSSSNGGFGYRAGTGSSTSARNITPAVYGGTAYTTGKFGSGLYGSGNTTNNNYEYRLASLPAGTYTVAVGLGEFWTGPRKITVTVVNGASGTGTTVATVGTAIETSSSITQTTASVTFTTTATIATPLIRFTATTGQDAVVCWIAISDPTRIDANELTGIVTNTNFAVYVQDANRESITSKLPSQVTATTASAGNVTCDVDWNTASIAQGKAYDTITVTGTATGPTGKTMAVTSDIEVVPRNIKYFVDAGSMIAYSGRKDAGSRAFDSVLGLVGSGLLNTVADQAKGTNSWGYTTGIASSGTGYMSAAIEEDGSYYIVSNYTDKYNYGWFGRGRTSSTDSAYISYDMTLPAGKYMLTVGVQEYWPSTANAHNRPFNVYVTDSSGTVLATESSFVLYTAAQSTATGVPGQLENVFFTLPENGVITVRVAYRYDSSLSNLDDPTLSWFAIAEQGFYATSSGSVSDGTYNATTLLENYTPNNVTNAHGILGIYGADEKLVAVQDVAVNVPSGVNPVSIANSAPATGGNQAAVYVWDAVYAPLTEKQTFGF